MLTLFSQQTTTITDNSGQSDPHVSFPLRQATQKQNPNKETNKKKNKQDGSHEHLLLRLINHKINDP